MKYKTSLFQLFLGMLVIFSLPILFLYLYKISSNTLLYIYISISLVCSIFVSISLYKIPKEKAHPYLTSFRLALVSIPFLVLVAIPFSRSNILITILTVVVAFLIPFISKHITYKLLTLNGQLPLTTNQNDWFNKDIKDVNTSTINSKFLKIFILILLSGGAIFSHYAIFGITEYVIFLIMRVLFSISLFYLILAVSTEIQKGRYINRNRSN